MMSSKPSNSAKRSVAEIEPSSSSSAIKLESSSSSSSHRSFQIMKRKNSCNSSARSSSHGARKERRVSPPDFLPPPTQPDPAGHDYQRPDESTRTAQSNDYNTWRPTRIGRFTSDDVQPVYNDLTAWRLK